MKIEGLLNRLIAPRLERKLDHLVAEMRSDDRKVDLLMSEVRSEMAEIKNNIKVGNPRQDREVFIGQKADVSAGDLYEKAFGTGSLPLPTAPRHIGLTSTFCRQAHFGLDEYRYWMSALHEPPTLRRKQWEYFYVCQALFEKDMLRPGRSGVVFGVGIEPLPALFAGMGCEILATDQATEDAQEKGWIDSSEHSEEVSALNKRNLCPEDLFRQNMRFRTADMNDVPDDLAGKFDFCWSTCCFEHLGSLEHGIRFVQSAMKTLKPGGVAVHTTEYNLSSNQYTIESPNLSIYRQRDIEELAKRLTDDGHTVAPLDFSPALGFVENLIDLPPYDHRLHIRLRLAEYDCTSVGIIATKGAA